MLQSTTTSLMVVFLIVLSLAAATFADFLTQRPDMNAIPELYPEKYTGLTRQQAPHNVTIPAHFNWCQEHGCTPNIQQHITYTPLCFLHASIHTLNDRIKFAMEGLGLPDVYLARQDYLDFAHLSQLGQNPLQDGGEGVDVMEYAHQQGIPDETCNPWKSDGLNHQQNSTENRCTNCMMLKNDNIQHCWPVPQFVKYRVKEYGYVRGEKEMMNEIFQRGPIQCGIVTEDDFIYHYKGGIYNDYGKYAHSGVDHEVEVIGWGTHFNATTNQPEDYWVIRNSWGSNLFGTMGIFLLARGSNVLRVEERCLWAQPDISELLTHISGQNVGTMFGLLPPNATTRTEPAHWEHLPHDFTPEEQLKKDAQAEQKTDAWMDKNIYNPKNEQLREQQDESIIVQDVTSPQDVPSHDEDVVDSNDSANDNVKLQTELNKKLAQNRGQIQKQEQQQQQQKHHKQQQSKTTITTTTESSSNGGLFAYVFSLAGFITMLVVVAIFVGIYFAYHRFVDTHNGYEPIPSLP